MPGIARVGVDTAGGTITGNLAPTVLVNGSPVAVKGAAVAGHAPGGVHLNPTMDGASATVFANGIPVCRAGDAATCGHAASGSGTVSAG